MQMPARNPWKPSKKAFQTAVEKAVDEKLKGGKPPKKAPETNTQEALEKQVYNAMMGIF